MSPHKSALSIILCLLFITTSSQASKLEIGSPYEEIEAVLGKPDGDLSAGSKRILTYGDAKVTLINGKATAYSSGFNKLLGERTKDKESIETKRASGLVNHKGEWITQEESKRLQLIEAQNAANSGAPVWLTNYSHALALARSQNKKLLLNFTGSDWCGWCIKLDDEVFSKKAFLDEARENYVLLKVDFPKQSSLPKELKLQNETLAKRYRIRGFPTVIVLKPNGKLHSLSGYVKGGPKAFIESIR